MRIRSTKPEFWRSERIASVSWDARLVLKALESYVDDNGVGKDDLALIVADCFSRDLVREPSRALARVTASIIELYEAGLVWRYDDDDTKLLYISWWESIQRIDRPTKGRFRRPDGTLHYGDSEIRECVANPREDDTSTRARNRGTGEQGNRGTVSLAHSADAEDATEIEADRFDEFWATYDKPTGKAKARQKWRRALSKPGVDADQLIAAADAYVSSQRAKGKHREFTKDPATWLNGEHWNDEIIANTADNAPASGDTAPWMKQGGGMW